MHNHMTSEPLLDILDAATSHVNTQVKDKILEVVVRQLTEEAEARIRSEVENLLKDLVINCQSFHDIADRGYNISHYIYWSENKKSVKKRVLYKTEIVDCDE